MGKTKRNDKSDKPEALATKKVAKPHQLPRVPLTSE